MSELAKIKRYYPKEIDIINLKTGDRVTRFKITELPLSDRPGKVEDVSFIGAELIFLGIANGCIYFERATQAEKMMFGAQAVWDASNHHRGIRSNIPNQKDNAGRD